MHELQGERGGGRAPISSEEAAWTQQSCFAPGARIPEESSSSRDPTLSGQRTEEGHKACASWA